MKLEEHLNIIHAI